MARNSCKSLVALFLIAAGQVLPTPAKDFTHPGGLHTLADLDRMKAKVAARERPWNVGWSQLVKEPQARNSWIADPRAQVSYSAEDDAAAMYYNALRWYVSGDESHAECAVRIANAWSAKSTGVSNLESSGVAVANFALAAEVLRVYPGWSARDLSAFQKLLVRNWFPRISDFLNQRNKNYDHGVETDAALMLAMLAIGVVCDDRVKFDQAVFYYKSGKGMGAIRNAFPIVHPGGLAQCRESGVSQRRVSEATAHLAQFCQVAWNQGLDLFGEADNRLLAGAEYSAQFNLWKGVPFTRAQTEGNASAPQISGAYRGWLVGAQWELLFNHYVVRKKLKAPHLQSMASVGRPEAADETSLGYGTLTFTLDGKASPYPPAPAPTVPMDLVATPGIGRVELKWSPPGAYATQGYEVFRATSAEGPFERRYFGNRLLCPEFVDVKVKEGETYFYTVGAMNREGRSAQSEPVGAGPAEVGGMPPDWRAGKGGDCRYSEAANGSWVVPAWGTGVSGETGSCNFTGRPVSGDFCITARVIAFSGTSSAGLMMREHSGEGAVAVSVTFEDRWGSRPTHLVRSSNVAKVNPEHGSPHSDQPYWLRLQRVGDGFASFQSTDGIEWFLVAKGPVKMAGDYLAGFAVSESATNRVISKQAEFDNVRVEIKPPPAPDPPADLTASPDGADAVRLEWRPVTAPHSGIKIECAYLNGPFDEIADLPSGSSRFVNTGLAEPKFTQYRVRSYNTGGYSPYPNPARVR